MEQADHRRAKFGPAVPERARSVEGGDPARHPISRWWLLPVAERLSAALATTAVRPWHVTATGFLASLAAAGALLWTAYPAAAAPLILLAWLCDRMDGELARRQGTATPLGAWLDANLDELADVGLQLAVAAAAARASGSAWPWACVIAFVAGKYLLSFGLTIERQVVAAETIRAAQNDAAITHGREGRETTDLGDEPLRATHPLDPSRGDEVRSFLQWCYHLPGNADVRVHFLVFMLCARWLTAELVVVALYYNLRWIARYVLVARRFVCAEKLSSHVDGQAPLRGAGGNA